MSLNFVPPDGAIAELEKKAADCEQKACKGGGALGVGTAAGGEALPGMGSSPALGALDILTPQG